MGGPDIPQPAPTPPPEPEIKIDAESAARQRAQIRRQQRGRDTLIVDPSVNTPEANQTGIRITY